MKRRRRETRRGGESPSGPKRRVDQKEEQKRAELWRHLQLAAAIMLVGLTTATLVCAGEYEKPWFVAAGGALFALGLLAYFLARPLSQWWLRK